MHLHLLFASVVVVLAALAVIIALALVIVWAWYAIRRILHANRHHPSRQEWGATRPDAGAGTLGATGRWMLLSWLVPALVLLSLDRRLPALLAWGTPSTLLVLGVGALVRQQRAPSLLDQPPLPTRTESPTTLASRSPPWSPPPSTRQPSPRVRRHESSGGGEVGRWLSRL
jgi:NADH:ubiquinone oxidoreductase subunit 3 (subunit A)